MSSNRKAQNNKQSQHVNPTIKSNQKQLLKDPVQNQRNQDNLPLDKNTQQTSSRKPHGNKRVVEGRDYNFSGHSDRTQAQLEHDEEQVPVKSPTQIPDPM